MTVLDQFKEELDIIRKARFTFTVGFIVLAIVIGVGEYSFIFKEWLARKDDVIGTLKQQLEAKTKPSQNATSNCSNPPQSTRGPAIATGTGVVANTGDSSTINNETSSSERKGKTPPH